MRRKSVTVRQLQEAIIKRRAKAAASVESFKGSQHPQILEMLHKCKGEVDAFDEVLNAIKYRSTFMLEH